MSIKKALFQPKSLAENIGLIVIYAIIAANMDYFIEILNISPEAVSFDRVQMFLAAVLGHCLYEMSIKPYLAERFLKNETTPNPKSKK